MKRLCLYAISLILAVTGVFFIYGSVHFAYADEDKEVITLPDESFYEISLGDTLTHVSNYAVGCLNDESSGYKDYFVYAFAVGNIIYEYECKTQNGSVVTDEDGTYLGGSIITISYFLNNIEKMEYADGVLYVMDSESKTYSIYGDSYAEAVYDFTEDGKYIEAGDEIIYTVAGGKFCLADFNVNDPQIYSSSDSDYSHLKQIGTNIYVLKGSTLCRVDGTMSEGFLVEDVLTQLNFKYYDYSESGDISTCNIADDLKTVFVNVVTINNADALLIRIDDASITDPYFSVLGVIHAKDADIDQNNFRYAHLLATSGDVSLLVYNGETYLTLTKNTTQSNTNIQSYSEPLKGYILTDTGVYSTPYACEATKLASLYQNEEVEINGLASALAFNADYYLVEYTLGEDTICGYVLKDFVSDNMFIEGDGGTIGDEPSYENSVLQAVLVLVFVALAVIALIYVTVVLTSKKRKKNSGDNC